MGKKNDNPVSQVPKEVVTSAQAGFKGTQTPSPLEGEMGGVSQNFMNNYNQAVTQNTKDYGDIMGRYGSFMSGLKGPSNFSYQKVSANRPAELNEAYGTLRKGEQGYENFAQTGGYTPGEIADLRARGISPIRAAYGNTMMELNRARALGGGGGAPNYIAALTQAQNTLPQQLSDAMENVNANLAESVRAGKEFGLQGITGTGQAMGGLSSEEAGRQLQAALANQGADLQTQAMHEKSLQDLRGAQLAGMGGMASLYGTTPGMASTFGNQALNAYNTRAGMEAARNQLGLGYLNSQISAYGAVPGQQNIPWWQQALGIGGSIAGVFSSRELKEDIKPIRNVSKFASRLKGLPLYTWKYKGDTVRHFGPIAEEFKKQFGIGDGKTIHLADVMGVVLASQKEALANA